MLPEPIKAAYSVIKVFEQLDIPYFLGGSFASITHGIVRTTQDVDIVADIQAVNISEVVERLQVDFYIDEEMAIKAVAKRGSLNILHRESLFKVDIFIPQNRRFEQSQFQRAKSQSLASGEKMEARIASAEDILLAKLEWYRQGGEVSERQWRDVLGIIKVQGKSLDVEYLLLWAKELGVSDLLGKLFPEAGTE